jgi:hypothetical protein
LLAVRSLSPHPFVIVTVLGFSCPTQGGDVDGSVSIIVYVSDSLGASVRSYWNKGGEIETVSVLPNSNITGDATAAAEYMANNADNLLNAGLDVGNGASVVSNSAMMASTLQSSLDRCSGVTCGEFGVCVYGQCFCLDGVSGEFCDQHAHTSRRLSVVDELEACAASGRCPPLAQTCPGSSIGVYNSALVATLGARIPKQECSGHGVCDRTESALGPVCTYVVMHPLAVLRLHPGSAAAP